MGHIAKSNMDIGIDIDIAVEDYDNFYDMANKIKKKLISADDDTEAGPGAVYDYYGAIVSSSLTGIDFISNLLYIHWTYSILEEKKLYQNLFSCSIYLFVLYLLFIIRRQQFLPPEFKFAFILSIIYSVFFFYDQGSN